MPVGRPKAPPSSIKNQKTKRRQFSTILKPHLPAAPEVAESAATAIDNLDVADSFGPPASVPALEANTRIKRRRLELLETYARRELRRLCLEDDNGFWIFLREVLYSSPEQRPHYIDNFHGEIAHELQHLGRGENFLLCIPRESRKTMLVIAYCAWLIVRDPDIRIKIVSNRQQRAIALSRLLREIFYVGSVKYPRFKEVFPDFLITPGRGETFQAQEFIHPKRRAAYLDATVYATFTGSTGAGGRCDVMIIDDGWDNSTLTNPDQGVKVFQNVIDLIPLIEGSSLGRYKNLIITTTPWRYYDPTAIFLGLSSEKLDDTVENVVRSLPFKAMVRHAMEDPTVPCDVCPKSVTDRYPHGAPTFGAPPVLAPIFDLDTLMQRYNFYMTKPELGEQSFWLQYMCVYRSQSQDKFQPEWFVRIDKPCWADYKRRVLVVDDASKDFQQIGRGDYSVAKFGEFDADGRLLKVHALRSNKWTREQFINEIIAWCQATRWWPQFAVKEKVGVDNFLVDLQRAFNQWGHPVVTVPARRAGLGRKYDYIVGTLQGPYERREILTGSNYPLALFERDQYELMNLGSVSHDDMADADCLFFVEGVRIARAQDLVPRSASEWTPPTDLNLYDPRRPTQPTWVPSEAASLLEQVAQRPENSKLFEAIGFADVRFTPHENSSFGPGFSPSGDPDDSDWWPTG